MLTALRGDLLLEATDIYAVACDEKVATFRLTLELVSDHLLLHLIREGQV